MSYLRNVKVENEQKYLGFLMRNPSEAERVDNQLVLHKTSQVILRGIKTLAAKSVVVDVDTLHTTCLEFDPNLDANIIPDIYERYTDFTNIDFVRDTLRNDFLKQKVIPGVIEDLQVVSIQKDFLKPERLREIGNQLVTRIESNSVQFYRTTDLQQLHLQELDKRAQGVTRRSYGFNDLNSQMGDPAAAGEITIMFGMPGSLKSLLAKQMESNLIDTGVCVASYNPEMRTETNVDRLICVREGIPLDALRLKPGQSYHPDLLKTIKDGLQKLADIQTYLYSPQEHLTLALLDDSLYQVKEIFHRLGVLPADEYIFITLDLLSMVRGFQHKEQIEESINVTHEIIKRHRGHLLGLVQSNENKYRGGKIIKEPEELDSYRIGFEDIKGGAAYRERARVVFGINRNLYLKKLFFPGHDYREQWNAEPDILDVDCIKQTNGDLFSAKFIFDSTRISTWRGAGSWD